MKTTALLSVGLTVLCLATSRDARAELALTAAGVTDGFNLSVFANQIPNNGSYGPMGSATTSSGNVLVTDFGGSPPSTFSWNDVDGQTPGSALANTSIGTGNFGITNAQGKIYAVNFGSGNIDILNNDGSFNSVFMPLPGGVAGAGDGITTDPVNGHIYVDSFSGINDIDPVTATVRNVNAAKGDGITVSPDGATVYLAAGGVITGYDTTTGAATGFSVAIAGADGVGVISGGSIFDNYLIVNSNGGFLDLVDPTGTLVSQIANGGSRGDFVGVDNNNGSLFVSQTSEVIRLTCGPGCEFVTPSSPEPGSFALLGAGLLALGAATVRKFRS